MKKIRMGIVGAGVWGANHAKIYDEHIGAELVAICDRDIERAKAIATQYAIPEVYADYEEMARTSTCDAVAIVTPDFLHADIAVAFAKHGKHLLVEKPLATTVPDVERICAAVEESGVRCMVDLHNRWSPPFNTAKQSIDAEALGTPYSGYMRLNDIKWVATDMLGWSAQSSILWFLGSHSLDTLRWLLGAEARRVFSVKREGLLRDLGVDVPDVYLTTIEFTNGCIAQMENGWITPNGNTCINDIKCNLLCTKGMVSIDTSSHNIIQMVTEEKATTPDVLVSNTVFGTCKGFSYESIRDFVDRLIDGNEFRVTLEDARRGALTILAILESAESAMPVDVQL